MKRGVFSVRFSPDGIVWVFDEEYDGRKRAEDAARSRIDDGGVIAEVIRGKDRREGGFVVARFYADDWEPMEPYQPWAPILVGTNPKALASWVRPVFLGDWRWLQYKGVRQQQRKTRE